LVTCSLHHGGALLKVDCDCWATRTFSSPASWKPRRAEL
jgi:hypothetical protein